MKILLAMLLLIQTSFTNAFVIQGTEYNLKVQRCGITSNEIFEIGDHISLENKDGIFIVTEIRTVDSYHGIVTSYCAEKLK